MSIDTININQAKKGHNIISPGEIVEGIAGLSGNLLPLDGRIIDINQYPELQKSQPNFNTDNILYPDSVIHTDIVHMPELGTGLYDVNLPDEINIYPTPNPRVLIVIPRYSSFDVSSQKATISMYKFSLDSMRITDIINFNPGLADGRIVSCGYSFIGNREYLCLRVGVTTLDTHLFFTDNNFATFTKNHCLIVLPILQYSQ